MRFTLLLLSSSSFLLTPQIWLGDRARGGGLQAEEERGIAQVDEEERVGGGA